MEEIQELNFDQDRSMASVRIISNLEPIVGADRIELATVGGWKTVVKKGEFEVGQKVIYFEIDSWIPHTIAPFHTSPNSTPRVYNGVHGQRLRTVKLRGQISQGLVLPMSVIPSYAIIHEDFWREGDDASMILLIQKWEKPMNAQLAGICRGNFPATIPKTNQDRIQNLSREYDTFKNLTWEVTEKLDGTSATFYLDSNGEFHVCSRNLDLKESEDNLYWQVARKLDIQNKMIAEGMLGVAIQGEICGPGIQNNQYGLTQPEFFCFDIFRESTGYDEQERRLIDVQRLNVNHAPIIARSFDINCLLSNTDETFCEAVLSFANRKSIINASVAEGLVFKCLTDASISFKAINNEWLLKNE